MILPAGSSDLLAQRRLEVGLALLAAGAAEDAAAAFEAALERDPDYPEALYSLGDALVMTGQGARAAESFRRYLALVPEDIMGAGLRLALLGESGPPERLPEAYVRKLFDQYAPRFDAILTKQLNYRAPQRLRAAVAALRQPGPGAFAILDLGCGTGLAGEAFKDWAYRLDGIDLSPGMVAKARSRRIYDALHIGDLAATPEQVGRRFDLVLAADVLVYVGDLLPTFDAVRQVLAPDGLFAFTVERADTPAYRLGPTCRFAHHPGYLADCAAATGLTILMLENDWTRTEKGQPVPGLTAVLGAAVPG